jgi:hypothetical protein
MVFKGKDGKPSPNSGVNLTPALPAPLVGSTASQDDEYTVEDYRTALRLLLGAALEGNDEFRVRSANWRETARQRALEAGAPLEEEGGSPLVYALLGLMFEAPEYLDRVVSAADRVSARAASFTFKLFRPVANSWFMRPVRRRFDGLVARGESVVHPLEARGRSEVRFSRDLIRQEVNDEAAEEFLTYLVERSKLQQLITEASAEVGGDALTEIRGRSATVDSSLDDLVDRFLRRQKQRTPPGSPSS